MKIHFGILCMALACVAAHASGPAYAYDDAGRLEKVLYPNGKGVAYTYDVRDNLTQIKPITIPRAVESLSIVALSQIEAQLSWEHSGEGFLFLVQRQVVGTEDWINGGSVDIAMRSATVPIPAGQDFRFRIVVIGNAQGVQSVPSDPVQLPSAIPLLVTILADENDHALGRGAGDSLREVIEAAIPGDVIHFSPDLLAQVFVPLGTPHDMDAIPSIFLAGTQLNIDKNLTIDASTLPNGIAIHAGGQSRVFAVSSANAVVLKRLAITGGNSNSGGGLVNEGGGLSLVDCVVSGNQSPDFGGGIYNGNGGSLNVVESTISGNSAGEGGGIYNASGGSLDVSFSSFSQNSATDGGGIYNRGASFTVDRSTFSGNDASSSGGGIFHTEVSGLIENCTLSGNASGNNSGGGLANNANASLILRHCTIADNVGAGVFNNPPAALTLDNTIVANNFNLLNSPFDLQGACTSVGANLVRVHAGTLLSGPVPITADPLLGPLASYGGATQTMPPLVGSPVIDAGVATANTPSTDQESSFRPNGPAPDIGSIESRLSADTDLEWLTTSAGPLSPTFRSSLTTYTATVPNSATTAAVRPASAQSGQTIEVRINGGAFNTVASKAASPELPLNAGENRIEVKVTAENGTTTKTYALTIIRGAPSAANAGLASLTTTSGALSPAFNPSVTGYHTIVSENTASTTVTTTPVSSGATLEVRSNFGPFSPLASGAASPPLALNVGANAIDLKVTAEDGVTTTLYTLTVTREAPALANANLAALSTSAGPLNPPFTRGVSIYQVTVPDAVTTATVTPTAAQVSATIQVRANGGAFSPVASGAASSPIGLNAGANVLEVKVTAPDGATVHSYSILVTRVIDNLEWVSKPGNDWSGNASISADCRYVAFSSRASNLVANDSNNHEDVFVYDRMTGTIERVSIADNGDEGDYDSTDPSISADGRYVAFQSEATNLVPNDTNGQNDRSFGRDIFVYDRTARTMERVSLTDTGGESNQASETPSISGDGRYVAFASGANNLVSGYANGEVNVYVHDRTTHSIVGISVPLGAFSANRNSLNPAISSDGNFVAFEFSVDKSVDSTPGYQYRDIYLYHRATRAVERITGTKVGLDADQTDSRSPSISADGRYVAFQSNLEDLDFHDVNFAVDVFVYDRTEGTTRRVSVNRAGVDEPYRESTHPSISGDGRYVAFESQASNLVSSDTNGSVDIFLKDLVTGDISLLSVDSAGAQGDSDSFLPSISYDGRCVAFESNATNLGSPDTNDASDVFAAVKEALAPSALADLASLNSNLGTLSPGFSPGVANYSASVPGEVDTARVRPGAADPGATVEARIHSGAFAPLPRGTESSLPLDGGMNSIDLKVTAEDGSTTKTYTLTVTRAPIVPPFSSNADLAGLEPSDGVLSPAFAKDTAIYEAIVPNTTTSLTIRPTLADPDATVTVNGATVASGAASSAIPLEVGSNTIILTVVAEDGVTTKTYAVAVTRAPNGNADLADLVPSVGALIPPFDPGTTAYSAGVSSETTVMTLMPTVAEPGATATVDGLPVASGTASGAIALNVGNTILTVVITAQDGVTTKTYTRTGAREAGGTYEITEFQYLDGAPPKLRITWQSQPGATYVLEQSADLNLWEEFGGELPSGGSATAVEVELAAPVSNEIFVRVRRQ